MSVWHLRDSIGAASKIDQLAKDVERLRGGDSGDRRCERRLGALLHVQAATWHDRTFVCRVTTYVDRLTGSNEIRQWARRRMDRSQNLRFKTISDELKGLGITGADEFAETHADLGLLLDAGLAIRHAIAHELRVPDTTRVTTDFWATCKELDGLVNAMLGGK